MKKIAVLCVGSIGALVGGRARARRDEAVKMRAIAMMICAAALLAASACGGPPVLSDSVVTTAASTSSLPTVEVSTTAGAATTELAPHSTTLPGDEQTMVTSPSRPEGPKIVITKSARRLDLYSDGVLLHTYRIALGFAPEGDKEREGDGRTPEGEFYVCVKNPESKFGLSLGVSYPSKDDAARGSREGLIDEQDYGRIIAAIDSGQAPPMKTSLGGEIYIHAGGSAKDRTQGCVGLEEGDMKELYADVEIGTTIIIKP
jgi:hypothetical protein